MRRLIALSSISLICISACGSAPQHLVDPIPDIPEHQQRTVRRSDFDGKWPLTVGIATLGCVSDGVVVRAAGVTYAVNDAAKSRGFAALDPVWISGAAGLPRNPLKRLRQDERTRIFAESSACDGSADPGRCRQRVRERRGLSADEWTQIEAEGQERRWPPLSPKRFKLDALTGAGLKLCTH